MIQRKWFRRSKPTVDCRELGRVLQSYLDHNIEADFAGKIASHLDECKKCGLEAVTYTKIKDSLGDQKSGVDPEVLDRLRTFGTELTEN